MPYYTSQLLQIATRSDTLGGLLILLTVIAVLALVFYLIRGFFLWYWRITEIVDNQAIQTGLLSQQLELLKEQNELLKAFKTQMGNAQDDVNKDPRL
jgi:hypothetical protein